MQQLMLKKVSGTREKQRWLRVPAFVGLPHEAAPQAPVNQGGIGIAARESPGAGQTAGASPREADCI